MIQKENRQAAKLAKHRALFGAKLDGDEVLLYQPIGVVAQSRGFSGETNARTPLVQH